MDIIGFTSSSAPKVTVYLSQDVRKHLLRHFNSEIPGSKFYYEGPDNLLQTIVDNYPNEIRTAPLNEYGCKVVSVTFPHIVGNSNVISLDDITEEELATLQIIKRGDMLARCVKSARRFPTKKCNLILDDMNNVITIYPGELAPPLPESPDIHDEYWDKHVFVEPE